MCDKFRTSSTEYFIQRIRFMPRRQSHLPTLPASWGADILFLAIVLGGLFFIFLGTRPLFAPDEGRYAEIAREMATSGNYTTPYLNGIIYFEKPALFYWLGAAAFKLGGVSIWSIRSINATLGLLGCLLTYLVVYKLYDRKTAFIAALILGTNLLYFVMAHMVSLDLTITVFLSMSLYSFLLGIKEMPGTKSRLYFYTATFAAALAVLTKGLIGIVFPVLIIGTWLTLMSKWRSLKDIPLFSCALLFLLIVTPWHLLVQLQHPGFFYFYFVEQHLLRYTDLSIGHYEPIWFFIPYLLIGFIPWTFFLPQTIKINLPRSWGQRNEYATQIFFLLWVVIIFLFFSFSKSKLIPYILPLFPALAILTARYVVTLRYKIIATIVTVAYATFLILLALVPIVDTRTILPLATILKPLLQPQDEVITYNQYYQDLPFYLQRRVSILNWQNELHYGMQHQDTHEWMINDTTFWQRWQSNQHVFVIMSKDEYLKLQKNHPKAGAHVLGETLHNVLISNTPLDMLRH
jgi:4-amino-4-deoxy-L-arabinose transferase-like glycosyltransferase